MHQAAQGMVVDGVPGPHRLAGQVFTAKMVMNIHEHPLLHILFHDRRIEQGMNQGAEAVIPDEGYRLPVARHQGVVGTAINRKRIIPLKTDHSQDTVKIKAQDILITGVQFGKMPGIAIVTGGKYRGQFGVPIRPGSFHFFRYTWQQSFKHFARRFLAFGNHPDIVTAEGGIRFKLDIVFRAVFGQAVGAR